MGQYNEGERTHKHAFQGDTVHDKHIKHSANADGHLKNATEFLAANHKEGKVWKVEKPTSVTNSKK